MALGVWVGQVSTSTAGNINPRSNSIYSFPPRFLVDLPKTLVWGNSAAITGIICRVYVAGSSSSAYRNQKLMQVLDSMHECSFIPRSPPRLNIRAEGIAGRSSLHILGQSQLEVCCPWKHSSTMGKFEPRSETQCV